MSKYTSLWEYIKNSKEDNLELTFKEIEIIIGQTIDNSFLSYKKELTEYGYKVGKISMKMQTVTFEKTTKPIILYIYGKGGSIAEAEHYKKIFTEGKVIGFDYKAKTPMTAIEEFPLIFNSIPSKDRDIILIANSIGAYYSMLSLPQERIKKAYFISPIVDMEKLIINMLQWANVTEKDLEEQGEIQIAFDEPLSWSYLKFVRCHPIRWNVPTEILYGSKDNLTSTQTIYDFSRNHNARLTVMENGEHWFHTEEQMRFLDKWITECKNNEEIKI